MRLTKTGLTAVALALGLTLSGVQAQQLDLLQTWQLALQHDPQYKADEAAARAGATQTGQARSLWLPTVGASATAGRGGHKSTTEGANFSAAPLNMNSNGVEFKNSISNGNLRAYELGITQPLLNRERLAQIRQLRLGAEVAELQWLQARQQLILRVVERYFDVLVARQTAQLLEQQYAQASKAQQETQARYELGDRPATDNHEATAQARTLEARLLQARMRQQLAETAYADLTGSQTQQLRAIDLEEPVAKPQLDSLAQWLEDVLHINPAIQMQSKGVRIAEEQIASYSGWQSPTLDLVGRLSHEKLDGSGRYGSAVNKADDWMVGVQLNVPIFTGGYRSAKRKEAVFQHEQQQAQALNVRQQIQQHTRTAWHAVQVSAQQVDALQQALQASKLRSESTRLGHQLGDKTTLEALDADNQMTSIQIELLNAKVALIVHQLQLAALVGALEQQHLAQANQYLQ